MCAYFPLNTLVKVKANFAHLLLSGCIVLFFKG